MAKEKIIVALDVAGEREAVNLASRLAGAVGVFKIGLELFTRCGPGIVAKVRDAGGGAAIFLDLKFHDIPNTVAGAVRAAVALDVQMLTIHLAGGRAMLAAAASDGALILGVSVLTSLDDAALHETGVEDGAAEQVVRLARLGMGCGLRGVVASPREIQSLRLALGDALTIVTPGVRPSWADANDQRRVLSPAEAIRAGADYLVIGRPITGAPDPRAAAGRIEEEIAGALA